MLDPNLWIQNTEFWFPHFVLSTRTNKGIISTVKFVLANLIFDWVVLRDAVRYGTRGK